MRFILPQRERIHANNHKDPLPYYYKPFLGGLYQDRLQIGLDLFPSPCDNILEIGVGSGILIPTLTAHHKYYTGVDLELAKGLESLVNPGCMANFQTMDLLDPRALGDRTFDAIACFSVLEHIEDSDGAARNLARLLSKGGTLVTGYPMVNRLMHAAFSAIAYHSIEDDHVSTPAKIHAALAKHLKLVNRAAIPRWSTITTALYQCSAWTH